MFGSVLSREVTDITQGGEGERSAGKENDPEVCVCVCVCAGVRAGVVCDECNIMFIHYFRSFMYTCLLY